MKAEILDISAYDAWNDFVESSPQASIYYNSWYLDALAMPFSLLVVKEKERIIGGFVVIKNRIKQYSNPLLCKYLGVIYGRMDGNEYTKETKRRKICAALLPEFKKKRSFNYSFHPEFHNFLPFYWNGYSATTVYTYILPLKDRTEEELLKGMHGKLRSEIKFGMSQGYEIVNDLDYDTFYEVNTMTYKRQGGSAPFKKEYLSNYYSALIKKEAIRFIGIRKDNYIIAVAGIIYDAHTTSLVLSGFDPDKIQRGANEVLIWETIRFASGHSEYYDFEGSMMASIDSFYRKFGGIHTPFLRIYKDNFLNFFTQKARQKYKKFKYGK